MVFRGLRIRGMLLDVDGTLLDSNDAHAQSWVEIFGATTSTFHSSACGR